MRHRSFRPSAFRPRSYPRRFIQPSHPASLIPPSAPASAALHVRSRLGVFLGCRHRIPRPIRHSLSLPALLFRAVPSALLLRARAERGAEEEGARQLARLRVGRGSGRSRSSGDHAWEGGDGVACGCRHQCRMGRQPRPWQERERREPCLEPCPNERIAHAPWRWRPDESSGLFFYFLEPGIAGGDPIWRSAALPKPFWPRLGLPITPLLG